VVVALPVLGSLIVGLMARFGSEKIRGHGIPEAIETILFGESRLSLKVALLKPCPRPSRSAAAGRLAPRARSS
jgi:H+/Cl- antiporter ClcA